MNSEYIKKQDEAKHSHNGGPWATGEMKLGEMRTNRGGLFICKVPHVAATENEPVPPTSSTGAWALDALEGAKDGTNKTFLIPSFIPVGAILLFWNGQKLTEGAEKDFTISERTVTLLSEFGPAATDELEAFYPCLSELEPLTVPGGGGSSSDITLALLHSAGLKNPVVDADEIPLRDSISPNVLKRLSVANMKATLKTYFDSIYAAASHYHAASAITSGYMDGDRLAAPTTTKRGGVKQFGTPSGKFYRDDDSWAVPAGGSGGGMGSPSVIVYVSGSTIYAVNPLTGATIASGSGTFNTNDADVINTAIAYVAALGGGVVYVKRAAYTPEATILCLPTVAVRVEHGALFTPTTNNHVFRIAARSALTCDGGAFSISTRASATFDHAHVFVDGTYELFEGDSACVVIDGIEMRGSSYNTNGAVGKGAGVLIQSGTDRPVMGVLGRNLYILGFEESIWLNQAGASSGTTSFVNNCEFENVWAVEYNIGILHTALILGGGIEGNRYRMDFEQWAHAEMAIDWVGPINKWQGTIWDGSPDVINATLRAGADANVLEGPGVYVSDLSVTYTNRYKNPLIDTCLFLDTPGNHTVPDYIDTVICDTSAAAGSMYLIIPRPYLHYNRPLTIIKKTAEATNTVTIQSTGWEQILSVAAPTGDDTVTIPAAALKTLVMNPYVQGNSFFWFAV